MTRILLLSDTHGYLDPRLQPYLEACDEIWHCGDIGSTEVLQQLRETKPTRAVYGNIDSGDVRYTLSEFYRFRVEEVNILMTHIGGYPGKYNPWLLPMFRKAAEEKAGNDPKGGIDLFVCGHSHILKVQYDKTWNFLTMNPGAAGKSGWQAVQTILRFVINGHEIKDLEVVELPR